MKQQKYVYVILSQTLTATGKMVRRFTKGKFSHASIALDEDLNYMYSFARFHYHSPLVAGFARESLASLSLGKNEELYVKIFRIPVTRLQYKKIKKNIRYIERNKNNYMYNLFALILYPVHIDFKIRDTYTCTSFVMHMLMQIDIKVEEFNSSRITPDKMADILKEYEYHTGSLQEYTEKVHHQHNDHNFFYRENIVIVTWKSIKQVARLIFRKFI